MDKIRSFFDWYQSGNIDGRSWLILGKGPSYDKYIEYDLSIFNIMSLNHVVDKMKVVAAHIIDLDVVDTCEESIYSNAQVLVMPWVPHVNNRPGSLDLSELVVKNSFLSRLNDEGRLLYYHHLSNRRFGDDPLVNVFYFSSEAAIDLLAKAGAKCIRTLGIDGGNLYGDSFSYLDDKTLLANGRKTFNKQFGSMAKIILKTGVDLAPLDIESPIRVYVAATEEQMLAAKILEYSIRKHASMNVEFFPIYIGGIDIPIPKNKYNVPRTPFSFQRFIVPELAGYQGRAIYLDSDMQVFKDLKNIWSLPFNNANILAVQGQKKTGRRPQFSVMILDCGRLDWDVRNIIKRLDSGDLAYEELMYDMVVADVIRADIGAEWNCLESYDEDKTALLHYTDMNTQPWLSAKNPLGYLWFRDLFEAIDSGFITSAYVKDQVERGYVRPSLWYQVEHRIEDSYLLPKAAKNLDLAYGSTFISSRKSKIKSFQSVSTFVKALIRNLLSRAGITMLRARIKAHFFKD